MAAPWHDPQYPDVEVTDFTEKENKPMNQSEPIDKVISDLVDCQVELQRYKEGCAGLNPAAYRQVVEAARDVASSLELMLDESDQGMTGTLDLRSWAKHGRNNLNLLRAVLSTVEIVKATRK